MATLDVRSGSNDRRLVANDSNHTNAVNSATANAGVESNANAQEIASDEFFTPDYYVRKAAMDFDTSGMGAGAIPTSGTLKITTTSALQDANNMSINIFFFTRSSAPGGAFDTNDFDDAKGTAACDTPKDITGMTGVQTFTLNAAALAAINTSGYTQFVLRISGDYNNSAPAGRNSIAGYMGNAVDEANRPRLELTYTPAESGGYFHQSV